MDGTSAVPGWGEVEGMTTLSYMSSYTPLVGRRLPQGEVAVDGVPSRSHREGTAAWVISQSIKGDCPKLYLQSPPACHGAVVSGEAGRWAWCWADGSPGAGPLVGCLAGSGP